MRPLPLRRPRSWRRIATLAVTAITLATVAACGSADDDPAGSTEPGAAAEAFPVSIAHKYGSTTIEAAPQRVVVTGLTEQDALLALGVVPVATTEWFGEQPGAIWPWAKDELGSSATPAVLSNVDGIQFEKIAALRPDLIVGMYSDLSQQDYGTLSKIAPTLAPPKGASNFGVTWQDATRTVGRAVGKSAEADKLVTDAEATLTAVGAGNPDFKGRSALMVTNYEGIFVYGAQDPRGRLLESMTLTLPPGLAAVTGDEFGKNLSRERTDLVDTDVLIWLVDKYDTARATAQRDPLYAALTVNKEGRDVFIEDGSTLGSATSFLTVLSLPYVVDNLVPLIQKAIDGDPATEVPATRAGA
jgi:iron complex transport system substrate-binding protein